MGTGVKEMNINIKNCEVNIITGTSTQEMAGVNIQRTYEDYSLFMANLDAVRVGDRVRVPGFKVPATEIDGKDKLNFGELEVVGEYATVYRIESEQISLVFDRALFKSMLDRNDTGLWEDTQLAAYLRGPFFDELRKETNAASCGLLRKEDLWGNNALPYFQNGRNRVCFDKEEDCSEWYWIETGVASYCGDRDYTAPSTSINYVRPCFIISAI
jgi:hypothetical protein